MLTLMTNSGWMYGISLIWWITGAIMTVVFIWLVFYVLMKKGNGRSLPGRNEQLDRLKDSYDNGEIDNEIFKKKVNEIM